MAYVTITKDLTEVKDKVAFGLTKRQIVCFSLGGIAGVGTYFLTRHSLGNDFALLLLIALAAPFMLFGLYEKNGQPLEKILKNIIRVRLLAPAARPKRLTMKRRFCLSFTASWSTISGRLWALNFP